MIVLHIEDNPADADYIAELLTDDHGAIKILNATTLRKGMQILSQTAIDVVLLDLCLPDSMGLTTAESLLRQAPHVPCVIVAGQQEHELALQAVRLGAHDCLAKRSIDSFALKKSIYYALERHRSQRQLLLNCAVSNALVQTSDEKEMLQACCQSIVDCLDAALVRIWTLDQDKKALNLQASAGLDTDIDGDHANIPVGHLNVTLLTDEGRPLLLDSIRNDQRINDRQWAKREGMASFAGYPLISHGEVFGVLALFAKHSLEDSALETLASVSRQLALGIERKNAVKQALLSEARDEFMATLSHDLKTPLIGMGRILEFLVGDKLGPITDTQREIFCQLQKSNGQILTMLQNLVEVYRYEKNTDCLFLENIDLAELAANCIGEVSALADQKHISITLNTADVRSPVYADSSAITRVIQNLLNNALKFTPRSGAITLNVHQDDATTTLDVHNTGSTICEEDRAFLFRRFWQGMHGRRYAAGSGLGLYLSKQIIEAHRGEICCRSPEQKGTTFSFTLPLAACKEPEKLEVTHV